MQRLVSPTNSATVQLNKQSSKSFAVLTACKTVQIVRIEPFVPTLSHWNRNNAYFYNFKWLFCLTIIVGVLYLVIIVIGLLVGRCAVLVVCGLGLLTGASFRCKLCLVYASLEVRRVISNLSYFIHNTNNLRTAHLTLYGPTRCSCVRAFRSLVKCRIAECGKSKVGSKLYR